MCVSCGTGGPGRADSGKISDLSSKSCGREKTASGVSHLKVRANKVRSNRMAEPTNGLLENHFSPTDPAVFLARSDRECAGKTARLHDPRS